MAILLVILAFVLVALCVVLFAVHKIKPESLRLKATLTRWLSLDLEVRK